MSPSKARWMSAEYGAFRRNVHYSRSVIELDVRDADASRSSFIVQDCFDYPVFCFCFCFFHMKMSIILSRSVKNCVEILKGIAFNL